MRSKEVEKAINDLNFIVVTDIYDNEVSIDKTKIINEYNQSLGIALDYIRKLEQLPNKIRDKIKELEEEKRAIIKIHESSRKYTGDIELNIKLKAINIKIQALNELIEGE